MFEDSSYDKLLYRAGLKGTGLISDLARVLIAVFICWLPLAIITIIRGSFWTGEIATSFITDFDVQSKLLVAMPIFILSDKIVSKKLALIIGQFTNSGIVEKKLKGKFETIVKSGRQFLSSRWIDLAVLIVCYAQVLVVVFYESESTSLLSWQVEGYETEPALNLAGKWSTFISVPFVLFFFYRWLLRIVVWGVMLFKISRLNLNLFPVHPDLVGGLGFLGYSINYFSTVAFAISAAVAGNMADFVLIEGVHLIDLRYLALGYLLLITFLFTFPLMLFSNQLVNAREKSVFENYDYTNGIYRELRLKMSKGYEQVGAEDLKLADFSAAADLSAVIDNALKMKLIPFTLKDLIPFWIMTALPFLGVVIIEIPVSVIFTRLVSLMM